MTTLSTPAQSVDPSHATTSTLGTPLTVGCLLTKSKLLLVLIVIYHRIQLERYFWISAYPTLICSLDPRNLPEASLNKLPNKKSRIHFLLQKRCLRKFGYSEHCVYTGAMLSFIYSLFGFWEFIVWSEGFRRCIFWYSYYGYFLEDWLWGT